MPTSRDIRSLNGTEIWFESNKTQRMRIVMIAIVGAMGTGLFLSAGVGMAAMALIWTLTLSGTASVFLAYIVLGILVYAVMTTLSRTQDWVFYQLLAYDLDLLFLDSVSLLRGIIEAQFWSATRVLIMMSSVIISLTYDLWQSTVPVSALQCVHVRAYGESAFSSAMMKVMNITFLVIAGHAWNDKDHPEPVNPFSSYFAAGLCSSFGTRDKYICIPKSIPVTSINSHNSTTITSDPKVNLESCRFLQKESNINSHSPNSPVSNVPIIAQATSILFPNVDFIQDQTLLQAVPYRHFSRAAYCRTRKEFQLQFT